jgi:hypothetical protein
MPRVRQQVNPDTAAVMWPGPFATEARAAYCRARGEGMSSGRALVLGCLASFKQPWIFRRTLAGFTGLCVRTVQRAITEAKGLGLLGTARAKPNEVPPGRSLPLPCGWSHRWIVGWGLALERAKEAVARARARRIARAGAHKVPKGPRVKQRAQRRWTAEQIDAELQGVPP